MKLIQYIIGKKVRYHITVVTGVLVIISVMALTTVSMILSVARDSANESAANNFKVSSLTALERTETLLQPALHLSSMTARIPDIDVPPVSESGIEHPAFLFFSRMLHEYSAFYSVYIGLEDGSFFQVINAKDRPLVKKAHDAPDDTELIVRTVYAQGKYRIQTFSFVNSGGEITRGGTSDDFNYEHRERGWYIEALEYDEPVLSSPYVFNSLKQPGITVSSRIPGGSGVVGVDLTISHLSLFVADQKISENGGIALFTDDRKEIASSEEIKRFFKIADEINPESEKIFTEPVEIVDNNVLFQSEIWDIAINRKLVFMSAAPIDDFMRGAVAMQNKIIIFALTILIITVPVVIFLSKRLALALIELTADAELVGKMKFDGELKVTTPIYEFNKLASGFTVMKATIAERTARLHETLKKLEMLVDMGIAMSAEFDIKKLSEMILSGAKQLSHAEGGSLYLLDESERFLEFTIVLNDRLGFSQGGTSGNPITMHPVQLYNEDGSENHFNVVTNTFFSKKTENIPDAYHNDKYDFSGTREFDKFNNYKSVSFLTVPLKLRGSNKVLGALQLINSKDLLTGEIIPFHEDIHGFVEALASAASVAIQNWNLLERQKKLFDDLVKFIASAIDAKSPYTARHCARVPVIAKMLSLAAEKSDEKPFESYNLDVFQKREFETAAWLHDCGKVTTPEYVIDKATKLETIYNRIHEIRTRFEVLLRDAVINRHEAVLGGADPEKEDAVLREREKQLYEDFAFIAECNIGTEYMSDESLEKLDRIASTEWLRFFDNRLGLSWSEAQRHEKLEYDSRADLPALEHLISDRRELIIERENFGQDCYDLYDFKFRVPEHLYNRGELYNLSVRKGTLTEEERFKIDEHVAQTIIMLEKLPFSEDLKNVPKYAGSHHETVDGTGYPRKVTLSELSIPERILAVADIFEALTSVDRPYKKDKTLSEIISIMYKMTQTGHIDPEIFNLLLKSGVYLEYGRKYLKPEQLDEVDVEKYMNSKTVSEA